MAGNNVVRVRQFGPVWTVWCGSKYQCWKFAVSKRQFLALVRADKSIPAIVRKNVG